MNHHIWKLVIIPFPHICSSVTIDQVQKWASACKLTTPSLSPVQSTRPNSTQLNWKKLKIAQFFVSRGILNIFRTGWVELSWVERSEQGFRCSSVALAVQRFNKSAVAVCFFCDQSGGFGLSVIIKVVAYYSHFWKSIVTTAIEVRCHFVISTCPLDFQQYFFSSLRSRTKSITANAIWFPIHCSFENVWKRQREAFYHA